MQIIVAFPFCAKDVLVLAKNLEWQSELRTNWPECVLSYDRTVTREWVTRIEQMARRCYKTTHLFQYPNPPAGWWPPNQAFQQTAKHMTAHKAPWLWFEPDMVPLCEHWLPMLQAAYDASGKEFFAPIIPDLGHYNGTGIYPSDAPNIIRSAMSESHTAWDVAMRSEMQDRAADASHVLQHCWTVVDGRPHPFGGGTEPYFSNKEDLRMLIPTAVLFHRDKELSLVDRLRECKREMK